MSAAPLADTQLCLETALQDMGSDHSGGVGGGTCKPKHVTQAYSSRLGPAFATTFTEEKAQQTNAKSKVKNPSHVKRSSALPLRFTPADSNIAFAPALPPPVPAKQVDAHTARRREAAWDFFDVRFPLPVYDALPGEECLWDNVEEADLGALFARMRARRQNEYSSRPRGRSEEPEGRRGEQRQAHRPMSPPPLSTLRERRRPNSCRPPRIQIPAPTPTHPSPAWMIPPPETSPARHPPSASPTRHRSSDKRAGENYPPPPHYTETSHWRMYQPATQQEQLDKTRYLYHDERSQDDFLSRSPPDNDVESEYGCADWGRGILKQCCDLPCRRTVVTHRM